MKVTKRNIPAVAIVLADKLTTEERKQVTVQNVTIVRAAADLISSTETLHTKNIQGILAYQH